MIDGTALICENGHLITDCIEYFTELNKPFCKICGAKTYSECPKCGKRIRGMKYFGQFDEWEEQPDFIFPAYCEECGNAFPWTEKAEAAIKAIIMEDEKLNANEQYNLVNSIPDIMCETPATNLAISRFKKMMKKASQITATAVLQFITKYGCEKVIELFK